MIELIVDRSGPHAINGNIKLTETAIMTAEDPEGAAAYQRPKPKPDTLEFAKRLQIAADRSDTVPRMNNGRFTYIQRELKQHHGYSMTRETIRKWFAGEARPRADKMLALSRVLKVDEAWLAVGASPSALPAGARSVAVSNEAAVNLMIGMMGMAGISCAQPDEDDSLADSVHFYAIINGRQWKMFVAVGQTNGDTIKFSGPGSYERVTTLGVVQRSISSYSIFQIAPQLIAKFGRSRGGYSELKGTVAGEGIQFGSETVSALSDFKSLSK